MKKIVILIMLTFLFCGCVRAEYWDGAATRPVVCCDDRPGCQALQAVMMGSFASLDPEDSLSVRVFSAALPRLTTVTEDDFDHFVQYFDIGKDALKQFYYIALGNCLWADIIINPLVEDMNEQNARTVLNLFLNPVGEDAATQMQIIHDSCTEEALLILAENAGVPVGFVKHLLLDPEI